MRPAEAAPPAEQERAVDAPTNTGWFVQVGAFSVRERAIAVARSLGAQVVTGDGLWRVRFTGLAGARAAEAALAKARDAGYTDARIQRAD
mgnify:FL=1